MGSMNCLLNGYLLWNNFYKFNLKKINIKKSELIYITDIPIFYSNLFNIKNMFNIAFCTFQKFFFI